MKNRFFLRIHLFWCKMHLKSIHSFFVIFIKIRANSKLSCSRIYT